MIPWVSRLYVEMPSGDQECLAGESPIWLDYFPIDMPIYISSYLVWQFSHFHAHL